MFIKINQGSNSPQQRGKILPQNIGLAAKFAIPRYQRSPLWHRKLRRVRSQTRKALRRGLRPSNSHLRELYSHHATSEDTRRDIRRMGKQNKQWGGGYSYVPYTQDAYSQATTWQYWDGAWKGKDTRKGAGRNPFPAYDDKARAQQLAKEERAAGNRPTSSMSLYEDPGSAMTHDLQECINAARRAEQKVRSLTATRKQKQALWTKWLDDMRNSYLREQQRHQRDMDRLSQELEMALKAQEAARAGCRAVAIGEMTAGGEAVDEDTAGWDEMLADWKAERANSEGPDAVLRRALATSDRLVTTPPRRGTQSLPMTPPAPSGAAAVRTQDHSQIVRDPYMVSPSHSTLPETTTAGPEEVAQEEAPTAAAAQRPRSTTQRQPIKQLPKAIPHAVSPSMGLADKLASKRAQYAEQVYQNPAMQPFRLPGPPSEPPPLPPQLAQQEGKGKGKGLDAQHVTISEGDTDEDEAMQEHPAAVT